MLLPRASQGARSTRHQVLGSRTSTCREALQMQMDVHENLHEQLELEGQQLRRHGLPLRLHVRCQRQGNFQLVTESEANPYWLSVMVRNIAGDGHCRLPVRIVRLECNEQGGRWGLRRRLVYFCPPSGAITVRIKTDRSQTAELTDCIPSGWLPRQSYDCGTNIQSGESPSSTYNQFRPCGQPSPSDTQSFQPADTPQDTSPPDTPAPAMTSDPATPAPVITSPPDTAPPDTPAAATSSPPDSGHSGHRPKRLPRPHLRARQHRPCRTRLPRWRP
ncbi:expansin [Klebsormidium nitens]|uniref:Expansin n=1 Tax=Klebsormidium nitens TaxID=105231 RepID=A0A1Y1I7B0_KLENI|nr:expansin [Klebsormidium nitens]|eukprot:GAQ85031.1 expansin [Klebsormidium nitens]